MLPTKYVHISEDWGRVLTKSRLRSLKRKGPYCLFIQQILTKGPHHLFIQQALTKETLYPGYWRMQRWNRHGSSRSFLPCREDIFIYISKHINIITSKGTNIVRKVQSDVEFVCSVIYLFWQKLIEYLLHPGTVVGVGCHSRCWDHSLHSSRGYKL